LTEHTAKRHAGRPPTHPGAILREDVLPALGLTVSEAARRLRVSRQTLHELLAERKGFTPEMALRVATLSGNGAAFWLRMQQDYELWHARRRVAARAARDRAGGNLRRSEHRPARGLVVHEYKMRSSSGHAPFRP